MRRLCGTAVAVILGLGVARLGMAADQPRYTYQKILSLGQAAPSGGTFEDNFQVSEINNNGQFTFLSVPGGNEQIFFWDGTAAKKIGGPPLKAPDGAEHQGNIYSPQGMNDAGKVVYGQSVTSPAGGRVEYTLLVDTKTSAVEILAKPEMPAADVGTFSGGGVAVPTRVLGDINNRDEVVFNNGLVPEDGSSTQDAVFMVVGGKTTVIARAGMTLPTGEVMLNAWAPRINDSSQVSFVANTEENPDYGVYMWDKGTITTVLKPGTEVGGVTIAQGKWAQIGNNGDVVFVAEVGESSGSADISDNTGVVLYSQGKLSLIVKPGDALPEGGTFRNVEQRRGSVVVNKDGTVAFIAVISNSEGGAFVYRGGQLEVVARTGMTLDGLGQIGAMGRDVSGFTGYHIGLNDKGQVLFPATVAGTQSMVVATPAP